MSKFIGGIFGFLSTIIVIGFCIFNNHDVNIYYLPFSDISITIPLPYPLLICLFWGFVVGGFMVWANGSDIRKTLKTQDKHIKDLERKLENKDK